MKLPRVNKFKRKIVCLQDCETFEEYLRNEESLMNTGCEEKFYIISEENVDNNRKYEEEGNEAPTDDQVKDALDILERYAKKYSVSNEFRNSLKAINLECLNNFKAFERSCSVIDYYKK